MKVFYLACFLSLFASFASAQQRYIANLTPLQNAIPNTTSISRGFCSLTLNQTETAANLICSYSEVFGNPANVGIYRASLRETGPLVQSLPGGQNGFNINLAVNSQFLTDLRANKLYVNVPTTVFPFGQIRGQLRLANGAYNDYDGDGRSDLVVYRTGDRTFYALQSVLGYWNQKQVGQAGDSVSLTVDFDGDGLSDFSTARYASQVTWRILDSSSGQLREINFGSSTLGDFFAAGDYDGDGKADIAVFRAGTWYIIESSTGTIRYDFWGQSGDAPAPNDYDRDGKADLTIARSESGQRVWYTRFSGSGQIRQVAFGLSSDAFFTGRSDFDGDGAADILVIRNQSGQRFFYILRSSDSQLQVIPWGLSSDVVKLGDYDGDGKTDPAITRAENGARVWYILQSSDSQPRIEYWGLAGDF